MRHLLTAGLCAGLLASTLGCISIEPQFDTQWIRDLVVERGGVRAEYRAGAQDCWSASEAAVGGLGLTVVEKSANTEMRGTLKDGTNWSLELEASGRAGTEIRVSIGVFGDEAQSKAIHAAIQAQLSAMGIEPSED